MRNKISRLFSHIHSNEEITNKYTTDYVDSYGSLKEFAADYGGFRIYKISSTPDGPFTHYVIIRKPEDEIAIHKKPNIFNLLLVYDQDEPNNAGSEQARKRKSTYFTNKHSALFLVWGVIFAIILLFFHFSSTDNAHKVVNSTKQINISQEEVNKQVLSSLITAIKAEDFDYNKASSKDINVKQDGSTLEVRINIESIILFYPELNPQMDSYHNIAMYTFIACGKQIFTKYKNIDYLRLVFWGKGYDSYGKNAEIENFVVAMKRNTFEKVNWEVVGDPLMIMLKNYDPSIFQELYERDV